MKTEYRLFTCKYCHRFIEIDTYGPNEPTDDHREPICRNVEWNRCDEIHAQGQDSIARLAYRVYR